MSLYPININDNYGDNKPERAHVYNNLSYRFAYDQKKGESNQKVEYYEIDVRGYELSRG